MIFKTISLELYRPSRKKRDIMDEALKNYTSALKLLINRYKEKLTELASSEAAVSQTRLLYLPDKDVLKELNALNAEPFKDSIKKEFSAIAGAYIIQRKAGKAGYPVISLSDDEYKEKIDALINDYTFGDLSHKSFYKSENKILSHANRTHMIYFGRYSDKRDYCLLYDPSGRRFFAKMYLLNNAGKIKEKQKTDGRKLCYVSPGLPLMAPPKPERRYIILPLAFGKYQQKQLERALVNPSILHTARLIKKSGKYFLLINIECEKGREIKTETTLGIARSVNGIHYTIPEHNTGTIQIKKGEKKNLYVIAAEILQIARQHKSQVILESDGGKGDRVMNGKSLAPLSVTDYSRLSSILDYKLPEEGLPAPVHVSAYGLYDMCPKCGCKTRKNHVNDDIFACTECGFAANIEDIGSLGLALRLDKYKSDRIPICFKKFEYGTLYYNSRINFEVRIESGGELSEIYYQLRLLAESSIHCGSDTRKYSMLKKLRDAGKISDAVRFVDKTPADFREKAVNKS